MDVAAVRRLAGAREIADTTVHIPHPYPEGAAEAWIAELPDAYAEGRQAAFAVASREEGALLGCIGLVLAPEHLRAEMGYWIGVPYWGRGYATEAARAVLGFAFGPLGLHRVHAHHFTRNPASGTVLRRVGMRHEGRGREHVRKSGVHEDVELYGILRREWAEAGG